MMSEVRILLVDDEEFYLRLFSDILASRRYYVRSVTSAEQALALMQEESFDVVITDLVMRGMDGLELTEHIRRTNTEVDIVVVTQRDDVRLAVRSMRMGVFEYLVKPVDRDELLLTLDRLLERRRLLDRQNKLLDESMQYFQAQTVYRRCLEILSTLDFENLCEMILRHTLLATGAQGGLLWLTSPEERPAADGAEKLNLTSYRGLVRLEDFPTGINITKGPLLDSFLAGSPFFGNPASLVGREEGPGQDSALFVPLLVDRLPIGLLVLLDKLHEDFSERDQNIARTMAQFSAIALKNSRRFQALERLGLRDQDSTAYNLTYFIDYAGKEIYKARRYGRNFSLVTIVIDRFEFLRQHFKAEICGRMSRKLAESISRVVRDSDILARVSDHEYYVLLPETDALGARMFIRRSQSAFMADSFIAEMSRDYPISISMGAATYPIGGGDFDQLLIACRLEVEAARGSLFRRLKLESLAFWDLVELLVGRPQDHLVKLGEASETFRLAQDAQTGSAHGVFSEVQVRGIEEEITRQAADVPERRAIIYAVGGDLSVLRPMEKALEGHQAIKAFLVGERNDGQKAGADLSSATRLLLDDERIGKHRIMLVLGERLAYSFLGLRADEGSYYGFHTSDKVLTENLISKLQEFYKFQRQY